jgi:cytochrome c-type biogenesis protein
VDIVAGWWISFLAGVFTPLGSVCVLPLYPGFLAFLSGQISAEHPRKTVLLLGLLVTAGVIVSMGLFGALYVTLVSVSLSQVISVISPVAFGILAVFSILLILNVDIGVILPNVGIPKSRSPYLSSFGFGFFFGIIVLPCNAASIVVLLALSSSPAGFAVNFINFIVFGIGMALPLLIFSVVSMEKSREVIGILTTHKRVINVIAGVLMLAVSLYYLFFTGLLPVTL